MRPFNTTIPFSEALALTLAAAVPIERVERVRLDEAHGRVIAESLVTDAEVPPFDRAAMDGFAVRAADTAGATAAQPVTLRCLGAIFTGQPVATSIGAGECMEIATGAPLPVGADAVVMVEETDRAGRPAADVARIMGSVRPRQNVSSRGSDMVAGECALQAGEVLTPSRMGVCAAIGRAEVTVFARPVVATVSTGSEIVQPGQPLGPAQIYDINRFTLSAIIESHGGLARPLPSAPDDLPALLRMLETAAAEADVIVFSGGSSVGEKDLVLDVMRASGEVIFHGISVKPGKPTALGRIGGRPMLGMPGNPTSCLSNAYLLLVPLLRRIARLPEHRPKPVVLPLSARVASTAARHQFYTVRIEAGQAVPVFKASGDITSMSRADGYIEVPAGVEAVEAGTMVQVTLF